ncbi:MAG: hypothetical protein QM655_14210 [Nocardioidaceae bacterium]
MTDLLKADFEAIRSLGRALGSEADSIRSIECIPLPVMPGSPIESASRTSDREVRLSFNYFADTIDELGDQISQAATTYEATEEAFANRLRAFRRGK